MGRIRRLTCTRRNFETRRVSRDEADRHRANSTRSVLIWIRRQLVVFTVYSGWQTITNCPPDKSPGITRALLARPAVPPPFSTPTRRNERVRSFNRERKSLLRVSTPCCYRWSLAVEYSTSDGHSVSIRSLWMRREFYGSDIFICGCLEFREALKLFCTEDGEFVDCSRHYWQTY